MTVIELGPELATHLRSEYTTAASPSWSARFEDVAPELGPFDLVAAATSFHWVPPGEGHRLAAAALRPGGWFAQWWNFFGDPDRPDPFRVTLEEVLTRLRAVAARHRRCAPVRAQHRRAGCRAGCDRELRTGRARGHLVDGRHSPTRPRAHVRVVLAVVGASRAAATTPCSTRSNDSPPRTWVVHRRAPVPHPDVPRTTAVPSLGSVPRRPRSLPRCLTTSTTTRRWLSQSTRRRPHRRTATYRSARCVVVDDRSSPAGTTSVSCTSDPTATPSFRVCGRRHGAGTWRLDDATLVVTIEPCRDVCRHAGQRPHRPGGVRRLRPEVGALRLALQPGRDPRLNHEFAVTPAPRRRVR